jgi:hypothetical protein
MQRDYVRAVEQYVGRHALSPALQRTARMTNEQISNWIVRRYGYHVPDNFDAQAAV